MNSSESIIEKIIKEDIKPIPGWQFKGRNIALFIIYGFFLFVGAISFSIILFTIQQSDFLLLEHIGHSGIEFLLVIFPFFWLITLVIILIGSFYAIYNSKKGYKFSFSNLVYFNLGCSFLIGTLFFISGGSVWFEKTFSTGSGLYTSIESQKKDFWLKPDEGSLAGEIISINDTSIYLVDFKNNKWEIDFESAFVAPSVSLAITEKIKIIGKRTGKNSFVAQRIMPWGGRGMKEKRHKQWGNYGKK
jgi:hypothetical protein